MEKYVIGIDLGGRSAKFGLFTTDGKLVGKSNIETRTEESGKYILPDIKLHLDEIFEKYDLDNDNLVGIGIGVPGPIIDKKIVSRAVNLGWDQVNIPEYMEGKIAAKFMVENDANVAALGEMWQGAAKGYRNVVMVTLGTGVGGGIIIDGNIVSGTTGSAGEIGHMPMLEKPLKRKCGCGKNTCLEQVASATGIENIARDYLFESDEKSILREIDDPTAKDIFEAAKQGDELACKVTEEYFDHLGRGLAIISAVVDPSIFVLGGGVSNAGDYLLDNVKKAYQKHAFINTRDADFTIAKLGNDAGIYGAARLLL